jgi:ribosomal protein S18 acetylase RimI-like enzyme
MPSLVFEILNKTHYKSVLSIADKCFGAQYISEKQLNTFSEDSSLSLVIKLDNRIIGFCLNEIVKKTNRQIDFLKNVASGDYPAGIIKTIAIEPKYQQKGYGAKLLDLSVSKLLKQNVKSLYYPAWNENNCERFLLKLQKINFTEISVIPDYWSRESVITNFHCARCGQPPCHCSLLLYKRQI